jgi:hypothetical protein
MMHMIPPMQTDRGRLRFFTISETRLDAGENGLPIVDRQKHRFAVEADDTIRPAREGEVTKFLGLLLRGPLSPAPQSAALHIGEDRLDCP